jgi:hypothetical protein
MRPTPLLTNLQAAEARREAMVEGCRQIADAAANLRPAVSHG